MANKRLEMGVLAGPCHHGQKPSSPALQTLISRPHSDFSTWDAVIRRPGFGSRME